ncbi:MAG: hypothetical protein WAV20_02825 [Blastocatellia bacterium]
MLTYLSSVRRQEEAFLLATPNPAFGETPVDAKQGKSLEKVSKNSIVDSPLQACYTLRTQMRSTAGDTFSDRVFACFLSAK